MKQLREYQVEPEWQTQGAPKRETQKIRNMTASLADGFVWLPWVKSKGGSASWRVPRCIGKKR